MPRLSGSFRHFASTISSRSPSMFDGSPSEERPMRCSVKRVFAAGFLVLLGIAGGVDIAAACDADCVIVSPPFCRRCQSVGEFTGITCQDFGPVAASSRRIPATSSQRRFRSRTWSSRRWSRKSARMTKSRPKAPILSQLQVETANRGGRRLGRPCICARVPKIKSQSQLYVASASV